MSIQSEKFALARAENKQKEAKIEELHNRLRKMSQDPKFTNEDRERIARQLQKLDSGKIDLDKLKSKKKPGKSKRKGGGSDYIINIDTSGLKKGGIVKKNKGGLMVTPKRAKRGY